MKTLVTKTKILVTKMKSLVTKTQSLVTKTQSLVTKMKSLVTKMKTLATKMVFAVAEIFGFEPKTRIFAKKLQNLPPVANELSRGKKMKLYKFVRQPDDMFAAGLNSACTTIVAAPTVFGLTAGTATALNAKALAFTSAVDDALAAELEYRKAVQAKDTARAEIALAFTTALAQSYATPSVTNAALASIGLDPKPVVGPITAPVTPGDLLGEALSTGRAKLRWKRLSNTSSTVFHVEATIDGGAWEEMWSGTRTRVELTNIAPGTPISFRVYAQKGDVVSDYSNIITFYEEGGSGALSLAA